MTVQDEMKRLIKELADAKTKMQILEQHVESLIFLLEAQAKVNEIERLNDGKA